MESKEIDHAQRASEHMEMLKDRAELRKLMRNRKPSPEEIRERMRKMYEKASAAEIGDIIPCPGCAHEHEKEYYNQKFCKERCKDFYHNVTDPERRERANEWGLD